MAITAENLAAKYKIPRAKVEQQLWKKAQDAGIYMVLCVLYNYFFILIFNQ